MHDAIDRTGAPLPTLPPTWELMICETLVAAVDSFIKISALEPHDFSDAQPHRRE